MHNGRNNYLKLYDAIAEQKQYEEKALIDKFKDEKFTNNFPMAKNYLYNIILKSLRYYHSGDNSEYRIRECLDRFDILFNKCLFHQCIKMINKAESLAKKYQLTDMQLPVLNRKLQLIKMNFFNYSKNEVNNILTNYMTAIEKTKNYYLYNQALIDLLQLEKQSGLLISGDLKKRFDYVTRRPLLQDPDHAASLWAKETFHAIWGQYYRIKNEQNYHNYHTDQTIRFFKQNPEYIKEWPWLYLYHLFQRVKLIFQRPQELKSILDHMEKIPESSPLVQTFKIFINNYCNFYLYFSTFDPAYKINPTRELKKLDHLDRSLFPSHRINLTFVFAFYAFAHGNYSSSLKIMHPLFTNTTYKNHKPLYYNAILLRVMNHYGLKNWDLVEQLSKTNYKECKKEKPGGYEIAFFNALRTMDYSSFASQRISTLNYLRKN